MIKLFKQAVLLVVFLLALNLVYRLDFLGFRSSFLFDLLSPVSFFFEKPKVIPVKESVKLNMLKEDNVTLQNEIKKLRQELQTRQNFVNTFIEVKVINFSINTIHINMGSARGVVKNQRVTVGNYLIGNVILVEKYRSVIGLLNNVSVKNFCFVEDGTHKIWGIVTGGSNQTIKIANISQEKNISEGDRVYCEGYMAGKIGKINKARSDLFYEAEVMPFINVEDFDTVYIEEAVN